VKISDIFGRMILQYGNYASVEQTNIMSMFKWSSALSCAELKTQIDQEFGTIEESPSIKFNLKRVSIMERSGTRLNQNILFR
jgi:hypothetical protein